MSDPTENWPEETPASTEAFADVELDEDGMPVESALYEAMKVVMDPEIGLDVVSLGLVYGFDKEPKPEGGGKVNLRMTLTSMGCPLTELIHTQATMALVRLPGVDEVDVEFTFSPPWSTEMIAPDAKEELRAMGMNV